jgi:thiamine pyrophosphate-dependent acetolactate synthase large subunit-like protein
VTACRRALAERRPVVLNVPADFMFRQCDCDERLTVAPAAPAAGPESAALDRAVGIIASARRPIVLAGRGAISPEARTALLALAERIGAPIATTLKGKDLFRGEEFDLGIFGTLSHAVAVEAISESDCVIAFGASLNSWTTARGAYLERKRVVQCDVDWRRLGDRARIDAGVAGDAGVVASAFASWLDEAGVPPADFRSGRLRGQLEELAVAPPSVQGPAGPPTLGGFLGALDAAVPGDRILVLDAGRFTYEAFTRLHVEHPRWFVPTVSFGSIGLGMGHAIGAACGCSSRPVLLVAGDGGFMLGGLAEFNTAVRYGLDVIVAICNDGSYGAEEAQLRARGLDPAIARFCWPDLATVAASLGGEGMTVADRDDLRNLPAAIARRKGPLLIDARLDPDGIEHRGH